jgi:hypothetical protein
MGLYADQYLSFLRTVCIHWDEPSIHYWTDWVWGQFLERTLLKNTQNSVALVHHSCVTQVQNHKFFIFWCWHTPINCAAHIQSVSRLVNVTAAGDFLGLCDQKSSCNHVSDFGRLRSYGAFFNSRTRPRAKYYRTSWRVIGGLSSALQALFFATWLAQFTTERQPVLRPAVAFAKISFKHRSIQIKCNFMMNLVILWS